MKRSIFVLVLGLLAYASFAQQMPDPDSILVGDRQLPKVLLVGTFHFEYYDLDAHVTDKDKRVNVMEQRRQKEMEDLVEYIAGFKPTAIAVEAGPNTTWLMKRYWHYKESDSLVHADEIEQVGFRVMDRSGLDTIHGVDASGLVEDLWQHRDSLQIRPLLDSIYADWDFRSDDATSHRYSALYSSFDDYHVKHSLLNSFLYQNSDKTLDRDYGAYLSGDFKLGSYRGADALAMHWYSRNLRIFRNIQELALKPDDRLLVLFGSGHVAILKQLFIASPEYELVKFGDL